MPNLERGSLPTCIAVVALATTLACSTPARTDDPSVAGPTSARPIEGPAPSASAAGERGYDVHEWGLVRAEQSGDKVRIGTVAPPIPAEAFIITKPVL